MTLKTTLKTLTAAVGLAIAGQAAALGPDVAPDVVIYGGGGAEQNNFFEAFASSLLNNIDSYTDSPTGAASANFRYIFGNLKVAAGIVPANAKVLIKYRSQNGVFFNGVDPLARGKNLNYFSIAGAVKVGTRYVINTATAAQEFQAPDFGLANSEVPLYTGPNLAVGEVALTVNELSNINRVPIYNIANGIAVSGNLFAQKPNFTRAEIAAILAGSLQDWSQLNDAAGNPLPEGPIILIDRNPGSGAKAGVNQYFLNNPGGKASGGAVEPINKSGDLGDPVNYAEYTVKTLPSAGVVGPELNLVQSKGQRGIGIIGRGNTPAGTDTWRFVSIDGVSIGATTFDKTNVISGSWDFFYTASIQTRNKVVNGKRFNQAGTAHGALLNALIAKAKDPAVTTTQPGIVLDPTIVSPGDFGGAFDAFITRGTRFGNSTAPLQLLF